MKTFHVRVSGEGNRIAFASLLVLRKWYFIFDGYTFRVTVTDHHVSRLESLCIQHEAISEPVL